jgi:hypothetical protein
MCNGSGNLVSMWPTCLASCHIVIGKLENVDSLPLHSKRAVPNQATGYRRRELLRVDRMSHDLVISGSAPLAAGTWRKGKYGPRAYRGKIQALVSVKRAASLPAFAVSSGTHSIHTGKLSFGRQWHSLNGAVLLCFFSLEFFSFFMVNPFITQRRVQVHQPKLPQQSTPLLVSDWRIFCLYTIKRALFWLLLLFTSAKHLIPAIPQRITCFCRRPLRLP